MSTTTVYICNGKACGDVCPRKEGPCKRTLKKEFAKNHGNGTFKEFTTQYGDTYRVEYDSVNWKL